MSLRIKKDNQTLASGTTLNIDAEELRNTKFSVTATISKPALEAAFAQGPPPTVEVVLRVHDNS